MSKKEPVSEHPMRQAEDVALNTYREWPVLLVLRQKELKAHLSPASTAQGQPPEVAEPKAEEKKQE